MTAKKTLKKASILKVKHKKKQYCHCRTFILSCHVRAYFFSSLSGLTRQSRDPRNALCLSGDDIEEAALERDNFSFVIAGLFSSPLSFPCLIRESEGDIRAKPEYDREEFEDDRRKNNTVIVGLDPTIKERDVRLKAEHDVEKRLNMTSCSQLDRNTGCGMNLR